MTAGLNDRTIDLTGWEFNKLPLVDAMDINQIWINHEADNNLVILVGPIMPPDGEDPDDGPWWHIYQDVEMEYDNQKPRFGKAYCLPDGYPGCSCQICADYNSAHLNKGKYFSCSDNKLKCPWCENPEQAADEAYNIRLAMMS